jgi:hypothetical protein
VTPELSPWQIPESAVLRSSGHRQLETPGFRMFVTPFLHRIQIPELRTFATSRLHRFQASENREFPAPEKHVSRTLLKSTIRGWRVFLNSPTNICFSLRIPDVSYIWIWQVNYTELLKLNSFFYLSYFFKVGTTQYLSRKSINCQKSRTSSYSHNHI